VFRFLGHFARSTQAEESVLHDRVGMLGFEFVEKFLHGLSVAGFVEAARCLGGQFLSGAY
jgi:hypothetical protein